MSALKYFLVLMILVTSSACYGQFSDNLLKQAEAGSIISQIELAKCYIEGKGVDQSQSEALKWYEKAAEKNNVEAMVACGDLLCDEWNIDLEPDYVRGMNWYRKAAAKGNVKAKEFIDSFKIVKEKISRECPFEWLPCDEDLNRYSFLKENEYHIKKEFDDKSPIAAYYLAIIAYIEKDYLSAVRYLTGIFPTVMNEDISFEDIFDKKEEEYSVPIEYTIAAKVFSLLGWCYEFGQGVEVDYAKAAEYYLSEFEYSAFGMSMIPRVRGAYCYKKAGLYDKFIEEANSQGFIMVGSSCSTRYVVPCLQLELAEMYKTGERVPHNLEKALDIYESIVDSRKIILYGPSFGWYPEIRSYSDIGRAAYRASRMYNNGEGCKADKEMAELYFEIALKYGDKNAWYDNQNK